MSSKFLPFRRLQVLDIRPIDLERTDHADAQLSPLDPRDEVTPSDFVARDPREPGHRWIMKEAEFRHFEPASSAEVEDLQRKIDGIESALRAAREQLQQAIADLGQ